MVRQNVGEHEKWRNAGCEREDSENVRDLRSMKSRKHAKEREWEQEREMEIGRMKVKARP
jgi:hypothetical protein